MAISQDPRSYMFEGEVYGALTDEAGVVTSDWSFLGNCTKAGFKLNAELKENIGNGRANFGLPIATVVNKQSADFSITFNELSPLLKSLLFMGDSSEVVQTSGSATDEAHTAPAPGKILPLGKYSVSSVVITGKTVNTDYQVVDAAAGLIKIIDGGNIAEDEALTISYDYAGINTEQTTMGTNIGQRLRLLISVKNKVTEDDAEFDLYSVQLMPNTEFDPFATEFQTVELTGKPIVPIGSTTGIGVFREKSAAA